MTIASPIRQPAPTARHSGLLSFNSLRTATVHKGIEAKEAAAGASPLASCSNPELAFKVLGSHVAPELKGSGVLHNRFACQIRCYEGCVRRRDFVAEHARSHDFVCMGEIVTDPTFRRGDLVSPFLRVAELDEASAEGLWTHGLDLAVGCPRNAADNAPSQTHPRTR